MSGVPKTSTGDAIARDGSESLWYDRLDIATARESSAEPDESRITDRPLTRLAVGAEALASRALGAVLVASAPEVLVEGVRNPERLVETWEFYGRPEVYADPKKTFPLPPVPEVEIGFARQLLATPTRGTVSNLHFASSFEPINPAIRDVYLADVGDAAAHARWWRHATGPRPTLVCVHGYQAGSHRLNTEFFDLRWLYVQGLDVVLFQLPFHGTRASTVEGWRFLSLDIARMGEAIAHSLWDLRALIGYLLAEEVPLVGVTGVSLGGYLAALLAGVDDRIGFGVPLAPAVSLADLVFDLPCLGAAMPKLLGTLGWGLDDLRRLMAFHTPLQHAPPLDPEQLMIVGAAGDRLCRPYQQYLLWENWNEPELFWHAGTHQFHLHRRRYRQALRRFLSGVGAIPN